MQFLTLLASASVVLAAAAPPPPATSSPSSVAPGVHGLPNWCDGGVVSDGSCEKLGLNTYCVRQKNHTVAFFGFPLFVSRPRITLLAQHACMPILTFSFPKCSRQKKGEFKIWRDVTKMPEGPVICKDFGATYCA